MVKSNLSKFRQEVRRLLKKHKKSVLARSVKASKLSSKKKGKKGNKSRVSVRRYRSRKSRSGGAIRDGSPQQFLKC